MEPSSSVVAVAVVFVILFASASGQSGFERCQAFGNFFGNRTACCLSSSSCSEVIADGVLEIVELTLPSETGDSCHVANKVRTFPLFGSAFGSRPALAIDQSNVRLLVEQKFCDMDFCGGFEGSCRQTYSPAEFEVSIPGASGPAKVTLQVATDCQCLSMRALEGGGERSPPPAQLELPAQLEPQAQLEPPGLTLTRPTPAYPTKESGGIMTVYSSCVGVGVSRTKPCIFPFTYNGHVYDLCTYVDDYRPWCATKLSATGHLVDGNFGYCTADCPINHLDCKTVFPGPVVNAYCVLPFRYKGVQYHVCPTVDDDEPWCATNVDSHGNYLHGHWGRCSCNGTTGTTGTTGSTPMFTSETSQLPTTEPTTKVSTPMFTSETSQLPTTEPTTKGSTMFTSETSQLPTTEPTTKASKKPTKAPFFRPRTLSTPTRPSTSASTIIEPVTTFPPVHTLQPRRPHLRKDQLPKDPSVATYIPENFEDPVLAVLRDLNVDVFASV